MRSTGLRFARNGATYSLSKIDGAFRSALGTRVTLGDDDSVQVNIPFSFPFYGNGRNVAFINSDGNITLEEEDKSSTERNLGRLVTGPPRIAPFFADLDPTMGSSKIFVNAAADQYTVTWCGVRGFDSTRTATVQATLLPDGSVEMKFADSTNVQESIVGISPGHTADIALVDLTSGNGSGGGAIAERFAQANSIDTFAVAKKFYATPSRQLRPDPVVDRSAAHPRRLRLRAEHRQRGPRHRPGHLRHLEPDRQRRPAAIAGDDGLARQVPGRSGGRSSWARTTRSACSARKSAIAGWPT